MTVTTSPPESPVAESPRLPRPHAGAAASDRRALTDHQTPIARHEMAKQQLDILKGRDTVLDMLHDFASHDLPGRPAHMQECIDQILGAAPAAG
jgi:hypothetical protein